MSKPKILIVEDDADLVPFIEDQLEEFGYQAIAAYNGVDGLEKAEKERPDLIVLDIMMPGIDGYEVCRRLRADNKTKHIPILMLTAKGQLQDRVKGFKTGADQYLPKPYHEAEFEAMIESLLKRFKPSNQEVSQPSQETQAQQVVLPPVDPYASVNSLTDPQRFFGTQRKQTVQKMASEIIGGINLAIFGMRRVGKTTQLNQLVLECERLGHPVAKMVCRPFSAQYTYAKILAEITQEWSRALVNLYPHFVMPARISINTRDSYDEDPDQFKVDVIELANAIRCEIGKSIRLVLALDEVDYIFPNHKTSLEAHDQYIHFTQILKSVLESPRQPGILSLVTVMEYPLINDLSTFDVEDQKLSNPLYDRFEKRGLDLLSRGDWQEMVQELGDFAGLKYSNESLEVLYHETKAHPEITRELGSVLVELRDRDEIDNFITRQEVYLALNYFLDDQSGYYLETTFWQDLLSTDLDTEQRIITALAEAERISKEDLFSQLLSDYKKFIDYKKGRAASDKEVERERHRMEDGLLRLLHLQVVTEDRQQKTFTISIPIYQKWVRQKILALEGYRYE